MIATKKLIYKIVTKLADIEKYEPVGSIKMYGGSTAPSRWLICDGSAVSRTTYSALFDVIGTTFGTGDGSTTFNLPDLRGRTAIGAGTGTAADATAHSLGSKSGTETVKLTSAESGVPQHQHALGTSGSVYLAGNAAEWPGSGGNAQNYKSAVSMTSLYTANNTAKAATSAHNNMQPYTTVNYIIFAGV